MGPLTFSKDGGSWRCPRRPRTTGIPERDLQTENVLSTQLRRNQHPGRLICPGSPAAECRKGRCSHIRTSGRGNDGVRELAR